MYWISCIVSCINVLDIIYRLRKKIKKSFYFLKVLFPVIKKKEKKFLNNDTQKTEIPTRFL